MESSVTVAPPAGGAGLVLAGGASLRMGTPKALLRDGRGRLFLEAACELVAAAGVEVWIVVGHGAGRVREGARAAPETAVLSRARWVTNPAPADGQVRSLAEGLADIARAGHRWALVALIDHPSASLTTARSLARAAASEPECLHVPVFRGRRGHPVVFPSSFAAALRGARPGEGARDVVVRCGLPVREHAVDDPGVLVDLDTPEELARWRAQAQEPRAGGEP